MENKKKRTKKYNLIKKINDNKLPKSSNTSERVIYERSKRNKTKKKKPFKKFLKITKKKITKIKVTEKV